MYAYIKSSGFIGDKGPRLLLVSSMLCCHDNGNVGLHVCAKFHDHTYTYTQCYMLIVKYKVM